MTLFEEAFELMERIEDAGGEAYIVGGAVRDLLMQRPVGDVDIATSLRPEYVQKVFDKVIPVGIEHGTVIVRHRGKSFEVTTFRTEKGYEDFRHPDQVFFVRDINEDLARRDFTMNAIALDRKGRFVDPYGGQRAVQDQVIQAVGDACERFGEDPLRMLRAARFASQLSFRLEERTRKALHNQAPLLKHIAVERIASEIIKLFAGKAYVDGLTVLEESTLIKELPILSEQFNLSLHTPAVSLQTWPEVISYFLANQVGDNLSHWTKSWKLSNKIYRNSEHLTLALERLKRESSVTRWLVYQLPEELFEAFSRLVLALDLGFSDIRQELNRVLHDLPIRSRDNLTFSSSDLISLFPSRSKGPWIREGLLSLEQAVVTGEVENEYARIKEWVQQWNQQENN